MGRYATARGWSRGAIALTALYALVLQTLLLAALPLQARALPPGHSGVAQTGQALSQISGGRLLADQIFAGTIDPSLFICSPGGGHDGGQGDNHHGTHQSCCTAACIAHGLLPPARGCALPCHSGALTRATPWQTPLTLAIARWPSDQTSARGPPA